ncbi:MAG: polyprenyl synthetase family protein [Armatimonadota bacterium]
MSTSALDIKRTSYCPEWTLPIADQLQLVEQTIRSVFESSVGIVEQVCSYVFTAGGKRLRPSLVLLSAGASGGNVNVPEVIQMAAAVELIHTASLLHDDVVDSAAARRGVSTANTVWGNTISVLGGDFLLSKAFCLLGELAGREIITVLSRAAVSMAESELLQATCEKNVELWQNEYWRIIRGKTASLMSACCESGAILSGSNQVVRFALRAYGEYFGLAFQITDDLLDITGDPERTGKQIGSDLVNGKFTLPVLLALNCKSFPSHALNRRDISAEEARQIAVNVVECGAAAEARQIARDLAGKACETLSGLEGSSYKRALEQLAISVVARDF